LGYSIRTYVDNALSLYQLRNPSRNQYSFD
jgi:hypothetical protein